MKGKVPSGHTRGLLTGFLFPRLASKSPQPPAPVLLPVCFHDLLFHPTSLFPPQVFNLQHPSISLVPGPGEAMEGSCRDHEGIPCPSVSPSSRMLT